MIALAVILLILVLIALIPVGVRLEYGDGDVLVQAAAGPVHVTLYPPKPINYRKEAKKQAKLRKKREKLQKKPPKPPKEPAPQRKFSLAELKPLLELGLELARGLPRKLLVRELTVHATFGGTDAAKTAIRYGRAWAVIGAAMPVLENTFRIQNRDVEARLDYTQERPSIFLRMDVRMRIGTGMFLGLKAGAQFLKILIQKKKKAVQANESSSV